MWGEQNEKAMAPASCHTVLLGDLNVLEEVLVQVSLFLSLPLSLSLSLSLSFILYGERLEQESLRASERQENLGRLMNFPEVAP